MEGRAYLRLWFHGDRPYGLGDMAARGQNRKLRDRFHIQEVENENRKWIKAINPQSLAMDVLPPSKAMCTF